MTEKYLKKEVKRPGSHSENLFLFIDSLMNEHSFTVPDLEAVLISEGPGSYTGLRIAASAVKGLLFEQDVLLFGINTLASLAQSAGKNVDSPYRIHGIIDARRKHVYYQRFVYKKSLIAKNEVSLTLIKEVENNVQKSDVIIGTGLNRIGEGIKAKAELFDKKHITAKSLINLYRTEAKDFLNQVKPENFEPKYYTSGQVN